MGGSIQRRLRGALTLAISVSLVSAAAAVAATSPSAQHVAATQQLAVLNHDTKAFQAPRSSSGSAGEVGEVRPITGERTVLPILSSGGGGAWLKVLLPGRPNSHTGWIPAASVSRTSTSWRIIVDLSTRKVTVFDNGHLTRTFSVVVGAPSTPTPTGNFFVEETVPLSPAIAGEPFALALSARSNALKEFDGGPGQVALHGLANIGGIPGTAVSHGCIRLPTADIAWLGQHISSGVPVTITK